MTTNQYLIEINSLNIEINSLKEKLFSTLTEKYNGKRLNVTTHSGVKHIDVFIKVARIDYADNTVILSGGDLYAWFDIARLDEQIEIVKEKSFKITRTICGQLEPFGSAPTREEALKKIKEDVIRRFESESTSSNIRFEREYTIREE